jgi:N-dimethylarginine dimethylaminohydrolase
VNVGDHVIMNSCTPELKKLLREIGFTVKTVNLSEFMKSGGSSKCLTLRL